MTLVAHILLLGGATVGVAILAGLSAHLPFAPTRSDPQLPHQPIDQRGEQHPNGDRQDDRDGDTPSGA